MGWLSNIFQTGTQAHIGDLKSTIAEFKVINLNLIGDTHALKVELKHERTKNEELYIKMLDMVKEQQINNNINNKNNINKSELIELTELENKVYSIYEGLKIKSFDSLCKEIDFLKSTSVRVYVSLIRKKGYNIKFI